MLLMGAGTLFFLVSFAAAVQKNNIGGMIASGLFVLAGGWQTYRIYQNIRLRHGVLSIDSEKVTWQINGETKIALLADVHRLDSWCGLTVLKNANGEKLISFPENLTNYNDVMAALVKHLRNE